jgi:GT2 family glycosyltransferase
MRAEHAAVAPWPPRRPMQREMQGTRVFTPTPWRLSLRRAPMAWKGSGAVARGFSDRFPLVSWAGMNRRRRGEKVPLEGAGDPGESATVAVSVIVPAYRGLATIGACLESVCNATAGQSVEIIVVESSGDGTAELVRRRFPAVRVIESASRLSSGAARNEGFRHAGGRLWLCVDQDCVVPRNWMARFVDMLGREGVGAAGGSIGVANPGNLSGWCVYFLEFFTHFPARGPVRSDNFLIGANSGWRSDAIGREVFPDRTLGEDLIASERVRRAGWTVLYDPSLTVQHHNRRGWREFMRYCREMGGAAAKSRTQLGGRVIGILHRLPILAFGIPFLILPRIVWRLVFAPPGYLLTFLALLPCCAVGHLAWANAFRKTLRQVRPRRITEP